MALRLGTSGIVRSIFDSDFCLDIFCIVLVSVQSGNFSDSDPDESPSQLREMALNSLHGSLRPSVLDVFACMHNETMHLHRDHLWSRREQNPWIIRNENAELHTGCAVLTHTNTHSSGPMSQPATFQLLMIETFSMTCK